MRLSRRRRSGATLVECAIVYPITFLLILGLIVGGMGMFRYQETASLAREAARWASVHGGQFAKDTGNPAATPADVYNNVIAPRAVALDLNKLTYAVAWNSDNNPYHSVVVNGTLTPVANTVSVTVTYQWIPEVYLGGITLSSTSVVTMQY